MERVQCFRTAVVLAAMLGSAAAFADADLPKVLVIGTGGTISGGVDPATGQEKSLTAKDLVDLVPSLKGKVLIEEEDYVRISSSSMTPEIQFRLALRVQELLRTRADLAGIVITHGTDSLEETAYLVDLAYDDARPVVFAAAQRPPRVSDSDGPRNLEGAILAAISPKSLGKGVLVVLNEDIHSARYVTKSHSIAVESFQSGKKGMLGTIDNGKVIYYNSPLNRLKIDTTRIEPAVGLVRLSAGDTGRFIAYAAEAKDAGIVVEAFGRGNMPPPVVEAVLKARKAGLMVVVVTRTQEGRVELPASLTREGVIEGEDLGGLKARILLMLALGATRDPVKIQQWFNQAAGTM
jgi:L-asparaginase